MTRPTVPAGCAITGFQTSRDGKLWILQVSGDTQPGDIFVAEAGGTNLRPLTNALPPEIEPANLVVKERAQGQGGLGLRGDRIQRNQNGPNHGSRLATHRGTKPTPPGKF